MSGLSKMIADFFVRENVIEHEEYEIYKYGSDILIENIGTTIFLICLGFIFNKEISTLIFIAVFAGIRRYSGGYHAKTKLKCYILTITNWAVVIVLQRLQQKFGFTRFGIELIICCMVFMVMFFFAPVENPGKPLFERVRIVNKRKTLAGTMAGIMFSMIAIESGSVWNSGIVHAIWNMVMIGGGLAIGQKADQFSVMTYVLDAKSFAVTGGEFGIEASVISLMGYIIVTGVAFGMNQHTDA